MAIKLPEQQQEPVSKRMTQEIKAGIHWFFFSEVAGCIG
jgi:hypothetical protein